MNIEPISEREINLFLAENPTWEIKEKKLLRKLEFSCFRRAFAFLSELALLAEQKNHHPEIKNIYKQVDLSLVTHEVGAVTEKDLELGRAIEKIVIFYESRAKS